MTMEKTLFLQGHYENLNWNPFFGMKRRLHDMVIAWHGLVARDDICAECGLRFWK